MASTGSSRSSGLKVLLVGSGAREHALAWKLSQSKRLSELFVSPGGDAWDPSWKRLSVAGSVSDPGYYDRLAAEASREGIDFLVVGPDNALSDGIVDSFRKKKIPAFGPTRSAARIESSKIFSKQVMKAAGIPTAAFRGFSRARDALKFLDSKPVQAWSGWVVKADGLALGKGVHVCRRLEDARVAVEKLISVSGKILIEEFLEGEEVSWLAICDGKKAALFESARDYKRVGDGNRGGNTGGMGCYSPVPGFGEDWRKRLEKEVFLPVLRQMKKKGAPFTGVLYAGLMVDRKSGRYWVLEFNARFGDPEAEVLIPRMQGDLLEVLWAAVGAKSRKLRTGKLPSRIAMKKDSAVYVVLAAQGYPDDPRKGDRITLPSGFQTPDYFLAGVKKSGGDWVTSGGRVMGALGMAKTLPSAQQKAYELASKVLFSGRQFRSDIGGVRFAVFASGRGSNFEAIVRAVREGKLSGHLVGLVTDQESAGAVEIAKRAGIPYQVVPAPQASSGDQAARRAEHEKKILDAIADWKVRFIVLAGYMRLLGPDLIRAFRSDAGYARIVNIHPSLLPAFPGLDSYRQAFEHGCKIAGATVHLVDESLDGGPICAQSSFSIESLSTADEVRARGLQLEHGLYPRTLNWVLSENFEIRNTGGRAHVHPN